MIVKWILLYGYETLYASPTCSGRMQVFVNKCLRKMLRVKWTDKISNQKIWKQTNQRPIEEEIGKRRWRWIGHTLRKPGGSISRKALDWNPQGKRSRGRPKGTWKRVVERDIHSSGQEWSEIKRLAQDREGWRMFVDGLYPDPGWERQWWWWWCNPNC